MGSPVNKFDFSGLWYLVMAAVIIGVIDGLIHLFGG